MTTQMAAAVTGQEHWTQKGDVRLFLWEKRAVTLSRGPACGDATVEARPATESKPQESRATDLRERANKPGEKLGTVLFVHGSSMASQSTFDLQVPARPHSSAMDFFAARGFDAWCVDMCSKLPLVDPGKISVPTIVMRGEFDGIAGFDDLLEFFKLLPNPDKQFAVMAGISHASFQQLNYLMVYHILHAFFSQPEPLYRG